LATFACASNTPELLVSGVIVNPGTRELALSTFVDLKTWLTLR